MVSSKPWPKRQTDISVIKTEIVRIRSLKIDDLRTLWRKTFKIDISKALTKDLIARMLIWRLQEQAFGGFDRATLKSLENYTREQPVESQRLRRLKPGTELVREYRGERHTVIVMTDGFLWRGVPYKTLSAIAIKITGTNWNGHRFFGLRAAEKTPAGELAFAMPGSSHSGDGTGDEPS